MSGLIASPPQIWLAVAPVDMRRGIDGLSSIVQQALGQVALRGFGVCVPQSRRQSLESYCFGMAMAFGVPTPFASRSFYLA